MEFLPSIQTLPCVISLPGYSRFGSRNGVGDEWNRRKAGKGSRRPTYFDVRCMTILPPVLHSSNAIHTISCFGLDKKKNETTPQSTIVQSTHWLVFSEVPLYSELVCLKHKLIICDKNIYIYITIHAFNNCMCNVSENNKEIWIIKILIVLSHLCAV